MTLLIVDIERSGNECHQRQERRATLSFEMRKVIRDFSFHSVKCRDAIGIAAAIWQAANATSFSVTRPEVLPLMTSLPCQPIHKTLYNVRVKVVRSRLS
jgi:hypothetical protein